MTIKNFLVTALLLTAVPVLADAQTVSSAASQSSITVDCPVLPEGIASFGACVSGNWLYVYSGHIGRAHQHSIENLSRAFRRLNLLDMKTWEELPPGPPLQSVSLVAHGRFVYRVGGLSAKNHKGEDEDLHSVDDFFRFDTLKRTWEELPSLPEPRSSHDATVAGSQVFVVGGWNLQGESKEWLRSSYVVDLSADTLEWKELPAAPFESRAIAVASLDGNLYAVGGITSERDLSSEVHVLDPRTGEWRQGPQLPDNGFGAAAVVVSGSLYVSGMDGVVRKLAEDHKAWEAVSTLVFPRFFHRFVAWDGGVLAVGGAAHGDHLRVIEPVNLGRTPSLSRTLSWTLPFPGDARNRQGVFLSGNRLYVFGGNESLRQHEFGPENFSSEGFYVELGSLRVQAVADFPVKRQSMRSIVVGKSESRDTHRSGFRRSRSRIFVVGGFGHDGERARSHAEVFSFEEKAGEWSRLSELLSPRSQFGLSFQQDRLWVFGGLDYDPRREKAQAFQHPLDVLTWDTGSESSFEPSGIRLPQPRRAFGGATLTEKFYLVGGMREDFELVETPDVFDFKSRSWERIPPPSRPRISPDLVALGGKLYLSGGSSPKSESGFEPNASLERFDPESSTWTELLDSLPVPSRHARMLRLRDRLLLYSTHNDLGALRISVVEPAVGKKEVATARF